MSDPQQRALVCSTEERLRAALQDSGYAVTPAPGAVEALPLVRHDRWDVIAIDATTARETVGYLHELPGIRRRSVFVVRVDEHGATGDRHQAWNESVDLIVNADDVDNIGLYIEAGQHDKAEFYERFLQVQREPGARLGAHA